MFNSKKGIDDKVSNQLTTLSSQSLIKGDCSIEGDMRIDGTIKANCVMQGNIYTTKLEIESQAKFNGSCNTNDMNQEVKLLEAVTE